MKVLVYGYGNPGRQDDGLGIFFADELEKYIKSDNLPDVNFETNYQLNAEDALEILKYDIVVFADAAAEQSEPFLFREIFPGKSIAFSTHFMAPESVLSLCEELYGKRPKAYIITFKSYSFNVNEPPTKEALESINKALEAVKGAIKSPEFLPPQK